MDTVVGGPGLRRGRRHPERVKFGDTLDFWRAQVFDRLQGMLAAGQDPDASDDSSEYERTMCACEDFDCPQEIELKTLEDCVDDPRLVVLLSGARVAHSSCLTDITPWARAQSDGAQGTIGQSPMPSS